MPLTGDPSNFMESSFVAKQRTRSTVLDCSPGSLVFN